MLTQMLGAMGLDIGSIMGKLKSLKPVEDRSTAQGSLFPLFNAFLGAWMTNAYPPLTQEFDNFLARLRSPSDPVWKEIPGEPGERMAVQTMVGSFLKSLQTKKLQVQKELAKHAQAQGNEGKPEAAGK